MTVASTVAAVTRALRRAGVARSPSTDARILVAHALWGRDDPASSAWELQQRILLHGITDTFPPSGNARAWLDAATRRRCAFEPVAYITGRHEFFGLPFTVADAGDRVLVPRPDSETLVTAALEGMVAGDDDDGRRHRVLDLGTGSGALLVAFMHAARKQCGAM